MQGMPTVESGLGIASSVAPAGPIVSYAHNLMKTEKKGCVFCGPIDKGNR